ncbi:MAG TPA: glycosyl hydrolase, partial [Armatimonadota bacterium]
DGTYHAYVSFVPGVPNDWSGDRYILHYTSANLWDWQFRSKLPLTSDRVIDACVHRLPSGKWRLWYKDEAHGSHQYAADSDDLFHWKAVGPNITDTAGEGPNVFLWRGWYWMVFDTWQGLGVRRSRNCESWTPQEVILREPGTRPEDGWLGQHADVLVQGDRAYLLYFVHPQRYQKHPEVIPGVEPYATRRTSLQVAELELVDGKLTCDRNKPFDFTLRPEE